MIAFIMGTPYCGSTLLASLLTETGGFFNIGELDRIKGVGENKNPLDPSLGYCAICAELGRKCPVFSDELIGHIKSADSHYNRYLAFSQLAKGKVLLDGSKHAYWLNTVCSDLTVRDLIRPIVLVRHPVSFVLSSMRRHPDDNPAWRWGEIWRDTYFDILRSCSRNNLPYLVVKHEDIILYSQRVLETIKSFCGVKTQLMLSDDSSHHYLGGNPEFTSRLAAEQDISIHDDRVIRESENFSLTKDIIFNVPGLFDIMHNIFTYN